MYMYMNVCTLRLPGLPSWPRESTRYELAITKRLLLPLHSQSASEAMAMRTMTLPSIGKARNEGSDDVMQTHKLTRKPQSNYRTSPLCCRLGKEKAYM